MSEQVIRQIIQVIEAALVPFKSVDMTDRLNALTACLIDTLTTHQHLSTQQAYAVVIDTFHQHVSKIKQDQGAVECRQRRAPARAARRPKKPGDR